MVLYASFNSGCVLICILQDKKMSDNVMERGSEQAVNVASNHFQRRQNQTFFRPTPNIQISSYYGFRSERDAGIALNAIGGYLIGSYFGITPFSFFSGLLLTIMLENYISDNLNLSANVSSATFGALVLVEALYFESEVLIGISMTILMYCLLKELGLLDKFLPELSPSLVSRESAVL
jgi:hypothetical protein